MPTGSTIVEEPIAGPYGRRWFVVAVVTPGAYTAAFNSRSTISFVPLEAAYEARVTNPPQISRSSVKFHDWM